MNETPSRWEERPAAEGSDRGCTLVRPVRTDRPVRASRSCIGCNLDILRPCADGTSDGCHGTTGGPGGPLLVPGIATCFTPQVATTAPSTPSAIPAGLARSQAARRRRVLDATVRLATSGGWDAVQMRDVAAEAQVALGTVYRYFSSKDRLLLEAMVEQQEALRDDLRRNPASGATAADRVVRVLRRANDSLHIYPDATAAMVRAFGSARPEDADIVERVSGLMTDVITGAIHAGTDDEPTDRDARVARVIMEVWAASLIAWVGGVHPSEQVDVDLEQATRLLIE